MDRRWLRPEAPGDPVVTRRIVALVTAAVLAAWPVSAQQPLPLPAPQNPPARSAQAEQDPPGETGTRIRREVNLVLVEATVKDKSGRVVDGLVQDDFQVYENGVAQQVTHFSRDELPLAVAVVVDLSGSIQPFLRPLRYATLTAVRTLKPEDEVALFTFHSRVEMVAGLTRDKRTVSDHFEYIRAGGGTNINDAVFEAARYLREQAPAARRVIVLVSDNVPSVAGSASARQVTEAALEADAAVYGLKIPGRNPRGMSIVSGRSFQSLVNVSKLTAETGGEIFDIEKEGSLYIAFQALITRLKTRYTLGYYPADAARDTKFRQLEVRLGARHGSQGRDYQILSKRGYYPRRASATPLDQRTTRP